MDTLTRLTTPRGGDRSRGGDPSGAGEEEPPYGGIRDSLVRLRSVTPATVATGILLCGLVLLAIVRWWGPTPAPRAPLTLPFASGVPTSAPAIAQPSGAGGSSPSSSVSTGPPHSVGPGQEAMEHGEEVVVAVGGAVRAPGLYRLPDGSRWSDALSAAGGPLPLADLDRVNLAARVVDEERVYVPAVGQEVPALAATGVVPRGSVPASGGSPSAGGTSLPAPPVDLNTADESALDELPGVGPATAAAIVRYRTQNGPFGSSEALLDVPGIGEAKLERLRGLVSPP